MAECFNTGNATVHRLRLRRLLLTIISRIHRLARILAVTQVLSRTPCGGRNKKGDLKIDRPCLVDHT